MMSKGLSNQFLYSLFRGRTSSKAWFYGNKLRGVVNMKSKAVVVNQNGEFLGALPNRTLVLLSSLAAIAMGLTFCGLPLISWKRHGITEISLHITVYLSYLLICYLWSSFSCPWSSIHNSSIRWSCTSLWRIFLKWLKTTQICYLTFL